MCKIHVHTATVTVSASAVLHTCTCNHRIRDFRFEYEYELPSLPKTNMKSKSSGNITGLKFKNRTHSQSRTHSPIKGL